MQKDNIVFKGRTEKLEGLIVRYPQMEDTALMLPYINKLSNERTFIIFQGEVITEKEENDYIRMHLNKMEKKQALVLICIKDKVLVSVADIIMKERNQKHVGVLGLTVAKKYRGMGVGSLMMKMLLREANKNLPGLKLITLNVFGDNSIAINLYKKFGFKEYGVLPKGTIYRERFIDYIEMYRELD